MKKFLLILTIFILSSITGLVQAQSHAFEQGQNIVFYPVSSSYKTMFSGFDCFYDVQKGIKNGTLNLKPKNRFAPNKEKLTPFSEIEGHSFVVKNIEKVTYNKTQYYYARLIRDDSKELFIAIPFFPTKVDNDITKSMLRAKYSTDWKTTTSLIAIPFIEVDKLNQLKEQFTDKYVVRGSIDNSKLRESVDVVKTYNIKTTFIDNRYWGKETRQSIYEDIVKLFDDVPDDCFYVGSFLKSKQITFFDVKNFAFSQPMAEIENNGKTYYFPITDLFGANESYRFKPWCEMYIDELYMNSGEALKYVIKKDNIEINNYKEGDVFYNGLRYPSLKSHSYGYYTFYTLCAYISKSKNADLETGVCLIDSDQKKIIVKYKDFKESMVTESDAKSEIRVLLNKFGEYYTKYYLTLSSEKQIDFYLAADEWGVLVADDIIHKKLRIGWNKEQCKASWGEPNKINKSTGSWGVHEQWCYSNNRYVYFENGRLTSFSE